MFNYRFDEDLFIPARLEKPVQEQIAEAPVTPNATPQTSSGNYHLIAGCFGNKDNADRLVADLQAKGFGAHVIDERNGLHRVAALSVASADEATQKGRELAQQGVETWLLVR